MSNDAIVKRLDALIKEMQDFQSELKRQKLPRAKDDVINGLQRAEAHVSMTKITFQRAAGAS